uniref:Uncharacterized protein n=1 Tax=Heterorhabditis bacteriophora TaxID=37862 RepID=A0A1I7XAA3_HETBA
MSNQLMFSDVLGKTFKPIPTLPSYFYYVPSPLEIKKKKKEQIIYYYLGNQSTADNGISAISSYSSEERTSKLKFKQVLNNTMKKQQKVNHL